MLEWWNDETHLLQGLSPFWEEWVQDSRSQKSLWAQELGLLHWEQVLVDRFQNMDHRPWGYQYDQFYTQPKLLQFDTIYCRQSKHNDLIHSLAEKHFLLQGQNPSVSLKPDHRAAAFSALHLTISTQQPRSGDCLSAAPGIQWLNWTAIIQMAKAEGRPQGLIWNSALRYIGRRCKWVQEEPILSTSPSAYVLHKHQEVSEAGATNRWRRDFPLLLLEYYCQWQAHVQQFGIQGSADISNRCKFPYTRGIQARTKLLDMGEL